MAERSGTRLWLMRAVYPTLALLILFAQLLPMQAAPARIAGPDLLVALTFVWALRRPDYVPMLSIAAVMLLADLLTQRPPGLWAALVLLAAEWLKAQDRRVRGNTFFAEWLTVATALMVIAVIYRVVLGLLVPGPGTLAMHAIQYGMTLAAYPLVAAISHIAFGVRHSAPGEFDPVGRGA
ncbi:rod shape-determining protein MreD [Citreimonas salinaria]|uniref:Rod shape-determining protein MreD n=1 Tax=Citreimonas salinaria TaxID=321339 RepID=A0A1H3JKQ6_9RHOB|nr:rod shape-determining protein MreD [Citreimonas salinaria]SDY40159.1 rod shape-determining protein MreD [Citreimonas salinaria]